MAREDAGVGCARLKGTVLAMVVLFALLSACASLDTRTAGRTDSQIASTVDPVPIGTISVEAGGGAATPMVTGTPHAVRTAFAAATPGAIETAIAAIAHSPGSVEEKLERTKLLAETMFPPQTAPPPTLSITLIGLIRSDTTPEDRWPKYKVRILGDGTVLFAGFYTERAKAISTISAEDARTIAEAIKNSGVIERVRSMNYKEFLETPLGTINTIWIQYGDYSGMASFLAKCQPKSEHSPQELCDLKKLIVDATDASRWVGEGLLP